MLAGLRAATSSMSMPPSVENSTSGARAAKSIHDGGIELALDRRRARSSSNSRTACPSIVMREDVAGTRCALIGAVGRLDAARFAALSGRHLRLHHAGTNFCESVRRLFRRSADIDRTASGYRLVPATPDLGSVFEEVHAAPPLWPICAQSGPNSSSSPGLSRCDRGDEMSDVEEVLVVQVFRDAVLLPGAATHA